MAELNIQGSNQELLGLGKDSKLGTKAPQPAADTKVVTPEEEVAQKAPTKAASQMEQTIRDILGDDLTNLGDGGTKIATGLQLGQSERGADIIRGVMLQEEGLKGLDKQAIIKQKINAATTAIAKQKQEIEFQKRQDEVKEQKTEDNAANVAALLRKAVSTPDPAARRDIAIQALTAANRRVDVTKPIIIEPSGEIAFNEITRMSDGSFQSVALKQANATDLAKTKETKALISNAISLGNADLENAMVKVSNESMFEGAKVADANIAEVGERQKLALSTSGQGRELRDTAQLQKSIRTGAGSFAESVARQQGGDENAPFNREIAAGTRSPTNVTADEDKTVSQLFAVSDINNVGNVIQAADDFISIKPSIDKMALNTDKLDSGSIADIKDFIKSGLGQIGVSVDDEQLSANEGFTEASNKIFIPLAKSLGANPSDRDAKIVKDTTGHTGKTVLGNKVYVGLTYVLGDISLEKKDLLRDLNSKGMTPEEMISEIDAFEKSKHDALFKTKTIIESGHKRGLKMSVILKTLEEFDLVRKGTFPEIKKKKGE